MTTIIKSQLRTKKRIVFSIAFKKSITKQRDKKITKSDRVTEHMIYRYNLPFLA